jgi:hypothetical protein
MKKLLVAVSATALIAGAAFAQNPNELNNVHILKAQNFARPGGNGSSNLSYHNGPVLHTARVVLIFWNGTNGAPYPASNYAQALVDFRNQFGGTNEYNVIGQYYDSTGHVNTIGNTAGYTLQGSQADWNDTTNPLPANGNVTDSLVQQEVQRYVASHGTDYNTVYEVVLPSKLTDGTNVYSSSGSSDSCGGPNLAYCAYHSHYSNGTSYVKYSIEPYPSCSGCQASGFTDIQNQEHFVCHETREAVTDPLGNAWYDVRGNEADDKCAWSPAPFTDGSDPTTGSGYGYQYEWANNANGCVTKQ